MLYDNWSPILIAIKKTLKSKIRSEVKPLFMESTKKKTSFYSPTPEEWKQLRLEVGFTQKEMAHLICTTERTIQRWESGERKIPPMAWKLHRLELKLD